MAVKRPVTLPSDSAPFVDAKTGKLTIAGRSCLSQIIALLNMCVTGPDVAIDENLAVFDGTSGKAIKDGGPP